jgi:hypothetical protein
LRVTASKIHIPVDSTGTAINLLHGDHAIALIEFGHFMVATTGSHDFGTPCITLVNGLACCSYNLHTAEVLGDRGRAEW